MMFSSCILFFGLCLVSQWRLSRGRYSPPSISVFPNGEVILGEAVIISCENKVYQNATFFLFKEGTSQELQEKSLISPFKRVSFYISNVQQSHGGRYWCIYCLSGEYDELCSRQSEKVAIVITEEIYSKPSISVIPGEVVTWEEKVAIHCKSEQHQKTEFTLHIQRFLDTQVIKKMGSDKVVFPIVNTENSVGGIYQCRYCFKSDSGFYQTCSMYSDRVYINVTDPHLTKPSFKMRPKEQISLGSDVTMECQGPKNYVVLTFFLLKSGSLIVSQTEELQKNTAEFLLSRVSQEDAGSYTCQYHGVNPFVRSEPSDPVELLVTVKVPIIMWSSIAAGLLVLLLLALVFVLYRRRGKGSIASERTQPVNIPLEPHTGEDPDGISYAVLSHHLLNTKQAADTDRVPESCTYASVAQGRTRESRQAGAIMDDVGTSWTLA